MLAGCGADPSDVAAPAPVTGPGPTAGPTVDPTGPDPSPTSTAIAVATSVAPPDLAAPVALSTETYGLTATLEQFREDEVAGKISVRVANGGDEPVVVETLRLAWPGLSDTGAAELDYPVFPGVRVDLKVPLGTAVCSSPPQIDEPLPDVPIAAVATTVEGEVVFPVTDPAGILARIYPRQCTAQAVEHAVGLTILDDFEDVSTDPAEVRGTLRVERRAATGEVAVVGLHGSVLVTLGLVDEPSVLGADDDVVDVPIVATNNRCDAHAISESKKPYVFVVDLDIDGTAVSYVISPAQPGKDALSAQVVGRCPEEIDP